MTYIKGIANHSFRLDTKFMDPLTKEKIIMNIHENGGPDLTYYGRQTAVVHTHLILHKDNWVLLPDESRSFFQEKEIFTKQIP